MYDKEFVGLSLILLGFMFFASAILAYPLYFKTWPAYTLLTMLTSAFFAATGIDAILQK